MSEKATLLTSIPPIEKSTAAEKTSVLTAVSNESTGSVGTVTSEGMPDAAGGETITTFQGAIYASFVLTFCLAGFAAVVLFRKASKIAEARFIVGAKALGAACGLIALHGFFATYLYANYLNGEGAIPLFVMMVLWAFVGPAIAVVLNNLLTPGSTPEKGAVIFDACAYVAIFSCAAIALVPNIKEDGALIFSLIGGFLFIVPVARSVAAFRKATARHPELRETSDQVLTYSLLFLPALLPILAFANVCNVSDELTLFLFNFITFDFVLIAGMAMIASADDLVPGGVESAEEAETPAPVAAQEPVAAPRQPQPTVVEFNAPRQPKSKPMPPRKPATAGGGLPAAPRKPGSKPAAAPEVPEATNAPSRIKAPSKPKKRF